MNLKVIIQKIASWFGIEVKTVEQDGIKLFDQVGNEVWSLARDGTIKITPSQPQQDATIMSTPAAAATPATTGNNVNTAVQLALALKAIDPSLSVEAVQAATSAALAAAYPVAAAA
jgi:hypothetical protein